MAEEPASKGTARHNITTVTCHDCGIVYVKSDQDNSDYAHFCEMKSLRPGATATSATVGQAPSPSSSSSSSIQDPSSMDVTIKSPSQLQRLSDGKAQNRETTLRPAAGHDDPNLPEEVRAAAKDPARLAKQYILVKQIGKGGMGTVWKAWDRNLSRWVAIKFLQGDSAEDVERFNREAKVAASVRHPNIASIFDVDIARGQHYIAMEYIDGVSMDALKVPIRELVEMMRQVSLAMDSAHRAGIVHRDLKPQNIMVTKQGWPFVLDFGLAKSVTGNQNLSVTGTIMGTPAYMPPEQAQGHTSKIDSRSDVYSLGATLYALVAKVVPFKGETAMDTVMKVVKEEPVDPRKHNPECPPEVSTVILKAMEKEPERRYQTASEFAEDLRRYLNDESLLAKPPSIRYKIVKKIQKNKLVFALAGTIGVAAVVVASLVFFRKPESPAYSDFLQTWGKAGKAIELVHYVPGTLDPASFNESIQKLGPLNPEQVKLGAVDWLAERVGRVEGNIKEWRPDRREWVKRRPEIEKILSWSKDVSRVVEQIQGGQPEKAEAFKDLGPRLMQVGADASKMLAYRGQARLRILVAPYATLKSLSADGVTLVKDGQGLETPDVKFPDKDLTTPLSLVDLEIRDYTLELSHPDHGTRRIRIDAAQLKDGGDFVLGGRMDKADGIALKELK